MTQQCAVPQPARAAPRWVTWENAGMVACVVAVGEGTWQALTELRAGPLPWWSFTWRFVAVSAFLIIGMTAAVEAVVTWAYPSREKAPQNDDASTHRDGDPVPDV